MYQNCTVSVPVFSRSDLRGLVCLVGFVCFWAVFEVFVAACRIIDLTVSVLSVFRLKDVLPVNPAMLELVILVTSMGGYI